MLKFSSNLNILAWFLLTVAGSSHAQTPAAPNAAAVQAAEPLEPGAWQVNTRPEMIGGQMMVLPRNTRLCLTSEDVQAGRIPVISIPACKVQEGGAWKDDKLTLKLACPGLPEHASFSGVLLAAGKSFQGKVEVILEPAKEGMERGHLIYHQTGTWLAAQCQPANAAGATNSAQ